MKKPIASLLATGALLAGSLVGFSATTASAATVCDLHIFTSNISTSTGTLNKNATLRKEPYSECGSLGVFAKGQKFDIWCAYRNAYDNLWLYGRIVGTETKAWIYEPNLNISTTGYYRYC